MLASCRCCGDVDTEWKLIQESLPLLSFVLLGMVFITVVFVLNLQLSAVCCQLPLVHDGLRNTNNSYIHLVCVA